MSEREIPAFREDHNHTDPDLDPVVLDYLQTTYGDHRPTEEKIFMRKIDVMESSPEDEPIHHPQDAQRLNYNDPRAKELRQRVDESLRRGVASVRFDLGAPAVEQALKNLDPDDETPRNHSPE